MKFKTENMLPCVVKPYVGILCPYADEDTSEILCWGTNKSCEEWRAGELTFLRLPRFGGIIPK